MSQWPAAVVQGARRNNQISNSAPAGLHQNVKIVYAGRTTNATQLALVSNGGVTSGDSLFGIPIGATAVVKATGVAKQNGSAEYKSATYIATVTNTGGVTTIAGSPTWVTLDVSGGAGSWAFSTVVDGTFTDSLVFKVTGVAATTIHWTVAIDVTIVAEATS